LPIVLSEMATILVLVHLHLPRDGNSSESRDRS
jgi:hypothetical protein